jgi:Uncharacterized protein conserved in bacteria (DUF2171)
MLSRNSTPLRSGWEVYGADGARIGTIADTSINYFVIEKGFRRTADLFVPRSAVIAVSDERVELRLTQDELEAGNFTSPIVDAQSSRDSKTAIDSGDGTDQQRGRP